MTTFLIMTVVVICLIGLAKGGLGGMPAILATPLMTLVMPADQAVGLLLPILLVADLFAITAHWKHWDNKLVLLLLPGALLGVVVGTFFLADLSPEALRRGIAMIALLFVAYKLFEERIQRSFSYQPRNWHGLAAGSITGVASTLAHIGPPPVTIYLLMQGIQPRTFVATAALFFTILNWLKVPSYLYANLINFQLFGQVAWFLPLLPLSVWIGRHLATTVDRAKFDRIMVVLLTLAALFLLFQ